MTTVDPSAHATIQNRLILNVNLTLTSLRCISGPNLSWSVDRFITTICAGIFSTPQACFELCCPLDCDVIETGCFYFCNDSDSTQTSI